MQKSLKKVAKRFGSIKKPLYLCANKMKEQWSISSEGPQSRPAAVPEFFQTSAKNVL